MLQSLFFTALFVTLSAGASWSQSADSVFLMNGQIFCGHVRDTSKSILITDLKNKTLNYEADQLYKIRFENGFNKYYYSEDSLAGNWLSREEMLLYMYGERDARKGFKARGALIGATVAGVIGGMTGTFWGPVLPYGFMALTGLPKVRIDHSTVSDTNNLKSEPYLMGYERVARQKMKIRSLIGGTIGLAFGYGFYFLFHEQYPSSIGM